jgi:hypothetical protein
MSTIFYLGFFMFVASTMAFIVAILNPYWIVKDAPRYRGIFEVCDSASTDMSDIRSCQYILLYNNLTDSNGYRSDYTIACSSLSIIAASLSVIYLWVAGLFLCVKNKFAQLRISEFLIAGTLLIDCITVVVWVVMLAKNLDSNNVITVNQIGWSLWLAVSSTGGFLIALVLFCIHRIDIGASPYTKSSL